MDSLTITPLIATPVTAEADPANHQKKAVDWRAIGFGLGAAAATAAFFLLFPPTRRWLGLAPLFKRPISPPPLPGSATLSPITAAEEVIDLASAWQWDPEGMLLRIKPFSAGVPRNWEPTPDQIRHLLLLRQLVVDLKVTLRLQVATKEGVSRGRRTLRQTRVAIYGPETNAILLARKVLEWVEINRLV